MLNWTGFSQIGDQLRLKYITENRCEGSLSITDTGCNPGMETRKPQPGRVENPKLRNEKPTSLIELNSDFCQKAIVTH